MHLNRAQDLEQEGGVTGSFEAFALDAEALGLPMGEQVDGGHLVWLVEENHPGLRTEIALLFEPATPAVLGNVLTDDFARFERRETGHRRNEWRRLKVSSELKSYSASPLVGQIFRLERERHDRRCGAGKVEVVCELTSLSHTETSAGDLLRLVCAYWGIKYGLHRRRDVTFREDCTPGAPPTPSSSMRPTRPSNAC
jgi:hypothetical protein